MRNEKAFKPKALDEQFKKLTYKGFLHCFQLSSKAAF